MFMHVLLRKLQFNTAPLSPVPYGETGSGTKGELSTEGNFIYKVSDLVALPKTLSHEQDR